MALSFGGIGALVSVHAFPANVQVRSMFFATVSLIILLLLAYLTNPSEASFRTYLTEQSFRQHLSRLNDADADSHSDPPDNPGVHYTLARRKSHHHHHRTLDTSPVVFSTGAKVSLRTPKHVLHNFAILTVAAVVPLGSTPPNAVNERSTRSEHSAVWDTWFIGAFGRWWRGGPIESWWHDSLVATKDEEGCRSGLFDIKASDPSDQYVGLPYATTPPPARSPPRLRQRERSAQLPARSATPPPLPKSASLPLHNPDYRDRPPSSTQCMQPFTPATDHPLARNNLFSAFDTTPAIADILRQIEASRAGVEDARAALGEFQAGAAQVRAGLQTELDRLRERKRGEDAGRGEGRARMRVWEEERRGAEVRKREAERRLRGVEARREGARGRVGELEKDIGALGQSMEEDEGAVGRAGEEVEGVEHAVRGAVEEKRKEIASAEEEVAALGSRLREAEEEVGRERERLGRARDEAEIRKQDRTFIPLHVVHTATAQEVQVGVAGWPPICCGPTEEAPPSVVVSSPEATHGGSDNTSTLSSADSPHPTKPARLSLAGISNLSRAKGYAIFDDDIARSVNTSFAPFDADTDGLGVGVGSATLIPSSLVQSIETTGEQAPGGEREREWRYGSGELTTSPTDERDPFEVHQRYVPIQPPHAVPFPARAHSDGEQREVGEWGGARRWFSVTSRERETETETPRRGLNPDAKVFSLGRKRSFGPIGSVLPSSASTPASSAASTTTFAPAYDPLSPSGPAFSSMSLSMRAFAPSPEEREVLGRSTNASLERLPSLSDVSPPPPPPQQQQQRSSWFAGLPRKMRFSPWEDEEEGRGEL